MRTFFRPALAAIIIFSVLTGVIYPALVTVIAQVAFPNQANGSLIEQAGQQRGSSLIGQQFDQPEYFWGRLSATGPVPYNAAASSGSNYGPLNPALAEAVQARIDALKAADPSNQLPIPVDLVTASASGLDPEISPAAANYQVQRVAAARGLAVEQVQQLVEQHTSQRTLGVLGEPRVNVLQLNIALDQLKSLD
ncbi:MAG: potassium-transporting ATPase subunit KdpC [Chloroflexi bacterium]|nr:potassium-transporting ATPase subunit KdpC [Chloroflexota bacterium]